MIGVVVFPGSNCELDVQWALRAIGAEAELVQHDVAEQRREWPALRRALPAWFLAAVPQAQRRPQALADQTQEALAAHLAPDPVHQPVVVHLIEEALQIDVHDVAFARSDVGLRGTHRVVMGRVLGGVHGRDLVRQHQGLAHHLGQALVALEVPHGRVGRRP